MYREKSDVADSRNFCIVSGRLRCCDRVGLYRDPILVKTIRGLMKCTMMILKTLYRLNSEKST